jgi:SAM-dependent methyltransferase
MPHPVEAVPQPRGLRLVWPLPALLAWLAGWGVLQTSLALALPPAGALAAALLASGSLAWRCDRPWRRGLAAAGFPLSAWALGAAAAVPAWVWLLLLLPVLAAYPMKAWRDAPFFPTPPDALRGLDAHISAPERVLDAGCGVGDGLLALRRLWPQATLTGLEWSAPLALLARWRCRRATVGVRRGDMWAASWSAQDLVYVFQRPESMDRVFAKARRELAPGAWLVSLEFPVLGVQPWASLQGAGRRSVWIYRMPPADARPARSTDGSACR